MAATQFYATGKRKLAIARAWISPGNGSIVVNGKQFEEYFFTLPNRVQVQSAFDLTNMQGQFDVKASVSGGGLTGQEGELRHAIAKALVVSNESLRSPLKKEGLLTRDARTKERKKYGQKGARSRFQYSKR